MSFRAKIGLLTGVITGGIILAAGWLLWEMTYQFNLEALDQKPLHIAQSNLGKAAGTAYWERLEDSLAYLHEDSGDGSVFRIWVEPFDHRSYISPEWPKAINPREYFLTTSVSSGGNLKDHVAQSRKRPGAELPAGTEISSLPILDKFSGDEHWRMGVYQSAYGNLAIAFNIDGFDARMNRLKWRFLIVIPIAILLAFLGAWFVTLRLLRPLEKLTATVESLTTEELDQRVEEVGHEKEFHRLVAVFNAMMQRLENSFHQASRFSADASHELKTPLTRLQMEIERAMSESAPASKEQIVYSSLLDETSRLSSIVKNLTLLSSSDAGKLPLTPEPVDLKQMLENVVEDWRFLDDSRVFELSATSSLTIQADRTLIEQAIQNLVSNAVKYGQADSTISIAVRSGERAARLSISNQGKPILEQDQAKLFDRFFRTDASRNANQSGVGLGLSLTREIVRAHQGEVCLLRSDSQATTFEISLPLAQ